MIFNKIKSHALIPVVSLLIFACDQTKESGNVDWVFVKGGNFHQGKNQFIISPMGDTIKNFTSPDRLVKLHDFYISKYEITVGQFRKFSESTGREMPRPPAISAFGDSINFKWKDDFPMLATWDEASEFAKWAGGRLPTEAEWEYAAKGGIQSMNYKYSGSNDAREVGWVFENADSILHPVGKLKPNELGLFDMTGNVNEWVSDWYNPERDDRNDTVNPRGPEY
ncbi:MAG: SUMF1/EgtB/PvdO family nonheme iron enzyme, partial [Flavobacteriaceae bacterium]|nr:SUMF1/EgtB/PvdO family nonheme iron enzyme [Flavobacteriaceae bacterium]